MPMQPIPIEGPPIGPGLPVGTAEAGSGFEVELEVFSGPLGLLLHLIESRQLDVLSVPLGDLANAYVAHLAANPVHPAQLAEFVAVAAQLILLKSRRLLPGEPAPPLEGGDDEPDEDELRQRLIEYRIMRDAAARLAERDLREPAMRREPRESDLPVAPSEPMSPRVLVAVLERLAATPEPEPPPAEVVLRDMTIGMQITALREALGRAGRVVLQQVLAACRSRTQVTVTLLATLELARRREIRVAQVELFGPILVERVDHTGTP
jgi:segregation and condensation protein A